jgi:hypothetical protein
LLLGEIYVGLSLHAKAREYFAQAVTPCRKTGNEEVADKARHRLDLLRDGQR